MRRLSAFMIFQRFAGNLARHGQTSFAIHMIAFVSRAFIQLQTSNGSDDRHAGVGNATSCQLTKPASWPISTAPSTLSKQLTTTRMEHRLPYPYDPVSSPT